MRLLTFDTFGVVADTFPSWKYSKKWASTVIVSLFTFISPVSSAMVAPATSQIVEEFGVHSSVVQAMMTSVFVLGYGACEVAICGSIFS